MSMRKNYPEPAGVPLDAVLFERSDEDGWTRSEIIQMLDKLALKENEEVEALRIEGNNSVACGFIRMSVLDELLDFNACQFEKEVAQVMNDANLEKPDHIYSFTQASIRTYLTYDE